MAARLTDRQKKRIIADYVESGSYNAVAKRHRVSKDTVRRVVQANADIAKKAQQKMEENSLDMLAYMDSRKQQAQGLIDVYLKALADPEKLAGASLNNIATALGIVVDKFTSVSNRMPQNHNENMKSLAELLQNPRENRKIEDFEEGANE